MSAHAPYFVEFSRNTGTLYMTGWDLTVIGGERLPGITEIDGAEIKLKRDPNAKPGSNGGRPVYHGLQEQELKIRVIVWTNPQVQRIWELKQLLVPLPGVEPKNRSIVSEWLKLSGISSVAIVSATDFQRHSSARVANGLQVVLTASHWLGSSKGAKKNTTVAPKRVYSTTRAYVDPATVSSQPTSKAGAVGPNFSGG